MQEPRTERCGALVPLVRLVKLVRLAASFELIKFLVNGVAD